jgi:hypothetical protein
MRRLFLVSAGFCMAAGAFCEGQTVPASAPSSHEIRVQLLDYRTGRPLKDRYVQLTVPWPNKDSGYHEEYPTAKTKKDGIAIFHFNGWLPPAGQVVLLDDWECSDLRLFATEEVLRQGLVEKFDADDHPMCRRHLTQLATAVPGVIVCYAHRLNFFQRFRRSVEE